VTKTALLSAMLSLTLSTLVAQAETTPPNAIEVAEAEGALRHRIATCQVPTTLRPYAELLSQRVIQVLVRKTALAPEAIEGHVARGTQLARDAMARNPTGLACSIREVNCLLVFLEERDAAISEMLGAAPLPKPHDWPLSDPSCDSSEDRDSASQEAAT
jgi:hypothetical protein